ncbi:AcrR family transcriptional regulator [Mycobacterium sp. MAA66]|uniref:TetR/AcrR family transcriptional regulator n=1 Tax=Mycobacterium sp. MAA66 TaxID=3156297 RepID=UPI003511F5CC
MAQPVRRAGGRSARVRSDVLAATTAILLEEGIDSATITAIAERSGVHHTSIYRRWGDRGTLICEALLDAVDTAVPVPHTGDLHDELTQMLDDVLALYQSPLGTALMGAIRSSDPALAQLGGVYFSARLEHCASIAERAKDRGELPATADYRLIFELLMGPFLARALLSSKDIKTLDSAAIVHAVLQGVTTATAPKSSPKVRSGKSRRRQ